ncbi:MAG: RloB domain-containing protein [Polyangiaceae bacterium]|nr:RloB domain-containing protein [Polyangiaceae bacterium]
MSTSRRKLLDRRVNVRDAAIYYIASEGTYAADLYFRALQSNGVIDRSRVKLIVLPSTGGQSAPKQLVYRLDDVRKGLDTKLPQDEFWLLPDIDHHRDKELSDVALLADQKGYLLAASNPCFEVWLILHETDNLSDLVTHGENSSAAAACVDKLRRLTGHYNKRMLDPSLYTAEKLFAAEERAKKIDNEARWPVEVGTHVHRLTMRLPRNFVAPR